VFAYFAAALVCFWATPLVVQRVVGSPALALATFAGVTVVAAAVLAVVSGGAAAANGWRRRFTWAPATWTGGQLVLGVKLYAVLVLVLVKATALPAFVYVPF